MKRTRLLLIALIALIIIAPACGGGEGTEAPEPSPPAPAPTEIPATEPPPPPTSTPPPTDTPAPTDTPEPTATPEPPPEPVTLSGSGDSVIDLDWPDKPALIHITGNTAERHFAVNNLDSDNESIDLLVNTSDPYTGWHPLDWRDDERTVRFEISATGDWTINVFPLAAIPEMQQRLLSIPGTREGMGDDLIFIDGTPDLVTINGNTTERHFAIVSWTATGRDLLVNTSDVYQGTVILAPDTFALVITATGPWTIEITAK